MVLWQSCELWGINRLNIVGKALSEIVAAIATVSRGSWQAACRPSTNAPKKDPPRCGLQFFQNFLGFCFDSNSSKILPKTILGDPPGHPKSIPGRFPSTLAQRKATFQPTVAQKAAKVGRKSAQRRSFWDPSASQKWPKTCPGTKKCVRKRRQRHFLLCFLAHVVRTRSPDRFLKGPTLQNRVPTISRSTILTKSPFSKKHRKSNLWAPVLALKMAKNLGSLQSVFQPLLCIPNDWSRRELSIGIKDSQFHALWLGIEPFLYFR